MHILRFFGLLHGLKSGLHNFQFFFVQGVEHGVNPLSALAPFIPGRIEIWIYRYIEHCHHLIKGIEAGVLAVILVIHDGTRSPVNNGYQNCGSSLVEFGTSNPNQKPQKHPPVLLSAFHFIIIREPDDCQTHRCC